MKNLTSVIVLWARGKLNNVMKKHAQHSLNNITSSQIKTNNKLATS